jgi:two-component system probable response regulator PhcQ
MMVTDRVLSLGIVAARLGGGVRNSLVAVRNFLDLVPDKLLEEKANLEEARNPNYWKELYAHARAQLRRSADLLTDLAGGAAVDDARRMDAVNLKEAVAQALDKLSDRLAQTGIAVANQIPAGLPAVMVEEDKFQKLLDLLLKDEMISLSAGNHVTFNARHRPGEREVVEMEVKDNGPGLPRDALRAVIDPFFARSDQYHEFGINLLACYFIVYHHGGKINVRCEAGQGATFTLTFPTKPKLDLPAVEEEAFLNRVLVNDAFWERIIAAAE